MNDERVAPSAVLAAWLDERGAALPPLPESVLSDVRQLAPEWWSTAGLGERDVDPTDAAVAAGTAGTLDHFLLVGRNGHGFASWFFHVVVAVGQLVVVARLLAPTAFDDELARPSLAHVLGAVGPLAEVAGEALAQGRLLGGERLVVLDDERSDRYVHGIARNGAIEWQLATSASLFADAAAAAISSP